MPSSGTEMRRKIDTALSSPGSGGWPRPSLMWHDWQERALNKGPSPSEARVDEGEDTQSFVNSPLPSLKSSSRANEVLAEGSEKASVVLRARTVVPPPLLTSKGSADEKSVVGAVTVAMRAASSAVRGMVCKGARVISQPAGVCAASAKALRPRPSAAAIFNGPDRNIGTDFYAGSSPRRSRAGAFLWVYWNTASGASRLSEPSSEMAVRSNAVTARSIERVWVTSRSTAPRISASPASLSRASIMS